MEGDVPPLQGESSALELPTWLQVDAQSASTEQLTEKLLAQKPGGLKQVPKSQSASPLSGSHVTSAQSKSALMTSQRKLLVEPHVPEETAVVNDSMVSPVEQQSQPPTVVVVVVLPTVVVVGRYANANRHKAAVIV